jgi:hypothetical protein
MRSISVTVTGAGVSNPIPMDLYISPFNVGFGVVPNSGVNYTVQHSFDNPLASGYTAAGATWFDHPTVQSQTVQQDGNYAFPVAAIRLKVNSGTNAATLTLIQAGVA